MAKYRVTGPDGSTYEVDGPDGASDDEVLARVRDFLTTQTSKPAQTPKPQMGMLQSIGRGMLSGAAMGWEDEIGLADKQRQKDSKAANPWTHFAGEVIGGIGATLIPGIGQARLAAGGGRLAKAGATALRPLVAAPVATTGQAAVQGAKLGASYGAISGAGNAESDQRLKGAGEGMLAGAAIGGVLGPAAFKAGEMINTTRAARQEMANADTASLSAIDRSLARDAIDPSALRAQIEVPQYGKLTTDQITRAAELASQGYPIRDIASQLQASPRVVSKAVSRFQAQNTSPLSIVDRARLTSAAGGENTSWTLRAGMASPGRGRAEAAERLTERQMSQGERLAAGVDDIVTAGDPQARMAAMRQAETTAYDAARTGAQPFDLTNIAQQRVQQNTGFTDPVSTQVRQAAEMFLPSAQGAYRPNANLEHFQRAKTALDQQIESSMVNGRATPLTRQLQQLKTDVMNEVSRTNPTWRQANDLFRENAAARSLYRDSETAGLRLTRDVEQELGQIEQAWRTVRGHTATPEQRAMAQARIDMNQDALSEAIQRIVLNKGETSDHVAQLLTPAAQRIMSVSLGQQQAARLTRLLREEQAITRNYRGLGGSQTTPLREAITELNSPALLTASANGLNPKKWLDALVMKASARMSEARNNRMVPMMVEADPFRQLQLLRDIETMRRTRVRGGAVGIRGTAPLSNAMQDAAGENQ